MDTVNNATPTEKPSGENKKTGHRKKKYARYFQEGRRAKNKALRKARNTKREIKLATLREKR